MSTFAPEPTLERHYTPQQVAESWGVSRQTVIRIFEREPGVLCIGHGESINKRGYRLLRIPESVLHRVKRGLRN